MNRWVYFALLAMIGACAGIINGNGWPGPGWDLILIGVMLALLAIEVRYITAEAREHEERRTYEASKDVTYSVLCAVLGNLDYKITMSDPDAGTLLFRAESSVRGYHGSAWRAGHLSIELTTRNQRSRSQAV